MRANPLQDRARRALVAVVATILAVVLAGCAGTDVGEAASRRKRMVPCELCRHFRRSKQDDEMMCAMLMRHVTALDGCTMGEERGG